MNLHHCNDQLQLKIINKCDKLPILANVCDSQCGFWSHSDFFSVINYVVLTNTQTQKRAFSYSRIGTPAAVHHVPPSNIFLQQPRMDKPNIDSGGGLLHFLATIAFSTPATARQFCLCRFCHKDISEKKRNIFSCVDVFNSILFPCYV